MTFPESERIEFRENPLAEVICQLNFPTVLAVASEAPAEFQNRIRADYPVYRRDDMMGQPPELSALFSQLPINLPHGVPLHRFQTADGTKTISLSSTYLSVSDKAYVRWLTFREEIERAKAAFEAVYAPVFYERVALRYQDVIDRDAIRIPDAAWDDLLDPALTGLLAAAEPIRAAIQQSGGNALVSIEEIEGGAVRLQYGVGQAVDTGQDVFVVDADLYTETRHEGADVYDILDHFNREAGNLFRWAIRPPLRDALGERESG